MLFTDDYTIKNGDSYIFNANYINTGVYSYIDNYDLEYSLTTMSVDDDYFTDDDYSRTDFPSIFVCQFIVVVMFYFVINKLTKLAIKGGV